VAGSRLLVEQAIYDESSEARERAKKMVPADPMDPKTRLGALVNVKQMNSVLGYVETGVQEGAKLSPADRASGQRQGFFEATVFDGVTPRTTRARRPSGRSSRPHLQGRGGSGRHRQLHDLQ
jgi:acyl-CoA reductase-like NAD-dependent aldehyde dehydrogenase